MKHVTTIFKEGAEGARAEVFEENGVYGIHYYMGIGDTNAFKTELFEGKHVTYVEDAAENWALGIKNLNG
jgi:hypothetical protein